MSKVTIDHLDFDFNHTEIEKHDECSEICVVPRKMVEMIIEECKKNEEALRPYYGEPFEDGADMAYMTIRDYAESLLKQFEED